MKTRIMLVSIGIIVTTFVIYNLILNPSETTTKQSTTPEKPKNGIIFNSTDNRYMLGQNIGFSITAITFQCEEVFDVQIFNYDYSELFWSESVTPTCQKSEEMVISTAKLPQNIPITIYQEGEYVVFVEILSLPLRLSDRFFIDGSDFTNSTKNLKEVQTFLALHPDAEVKIDYENKMVVYEKSGFREHPTSQIIQHTKRLYVLLYFEGSPKVGEVECGGHVTLSSPVGNVLEDPDWCFPADQTKFRHLKGE